MGVHLQDNGTLKHIARACLKDTKVLQQVSHHLVKDARLQVSVSGLILLTDLDRPLGEESLTPQNP